MPRSRRCRALDSQETLSLPRRTSPDTRRAIDESGERLDQLGLAVAFDAGDRRRSPRADVERDCDRPASAPPTVVTVKIADAQHRRAGLRRRVCRRAAARRARPSDAPARRRSCLSSCTRPTTFPSRITVTSSEIASTSASLCVMMTIVLPCCAHAAEDAEELVDFLRRQHGRRLVENQQPRIRDTALSTARRAAAARPTGPRRARADRQTA